MKQIITIKGKPVIEIYESLDGSYWFITEKLYKQDSVINGKVYKDDQILFGYVRLAACPEFAEWGNVSETELKLLGNWVWKVPKKNWHLCPEVEVKEIEDKQAEDADQEQSNSFQAGEKIKNLKKFKTKRLDNEQGIRKVKDNNNFWEKEKYVKNKFGSLNAGIETQKGIRAGNLFSDIYGIRHRGYQSGTRKAGTYKQRLSGYVRNYQPLKSLKMMSYKPVRLNLPKVYQKFFNSGRNQKHLYSGAKTIKMYNRQQGYESNELQRGWKRSLESYLNNCKGVAKNGMETYSLFD